MECISLDKMYSVKLGGNRKKVKKFEFNFNSYLRAVEQHGLLNQRLQFDSRSNRLALNLLYIELT